MQWQPLDFEKPIFELERRLQDLKNHSDAHDVDLDSAVNAVEEKLRETRREIYGNLTAWQRVQIARHTQRPFAMDYGLATLGTQRCVVITHQKGRNTKENVMRNFGCAHPEGYRKALRLMRLAEKFRVPIIAAVIGEGGSGGALGIGVADRVLILENAYYSVISPEACSAILWRDRRHAAEAAEALKLTAQDLLKLEVVDQIISEPEGGAHRDYDSVAGNLGAALRGALGEISKIPADELLEKRYRKFRRLGTFSESKAATASARS